MNVTLSLHDALPLPIWAVWIAAATSESEGSAADEDHDAEADEDDGEEDVLPAFEHFGDRGAGGDELCQGHQGRDEREEDDAVGDYCERFHAEEDRGVDADVVAAVGKGDACDCPHADLLAGNLGLVVKIGRA